MGGISKACQNKHLLSTKPTACIDLANAKGFLLSPANEYLRSMAVSRFNPNGDTADRVRKKLRLEKTVIYHR